DGGGAGWRHQHCYIARVHRRDHLSGSVASSPLPVRRERVRVRVHAIRARSWMKVNRAETLTLPSPGVPGEGQEAYRIGEILAAWWRSGLVLDVMVGVCQGEAVEGQVGSDGMDQFP